MPSPDVNPYEAASVAASDLGHHLGGAGFDVALGARLGLAGGGRAPGRDDGRGRAGQGVRVPRADRRRPRRHGPGHRGRTAGGCWCSWVGSTVRGSLAGDRGPRRAGRDRGRRRHRRADQRGRRRQPRPRRGPAGADPRSHQPHRPVAADRARAAGAVRVPVPRSHRPVLAAASGGSPGGRSRRWPKGCTPPSTGRTTRPRPRSGCCTRSAPTSSGCRRRWRRSPSITPEPRCWRCRW